MFELIKRLKWLRDQIDNVDDPNSLFAVDCPRIETIVTLAGEHLISNYEPNWYNIRSVEIQTGARIKIIEKAENGYYLCSILLKGHHILFS